MPFLENSILIITAAISIVWADSTSNSLRPGPDVDTFSYTSGYGKTYTALLPNTRSANDFTPIGFVRQPSFVRGAGLLNKGEHALLIYADGDLLPPALTLQYRYGLFYWWDIAYDIGGDDGVFQTFVRTRMENLKTRHTEAVFWSNEFSLGYKQHDFAVRDNLKFDDRSLVFTFDNSVSWRLGISRETALYLLSVYYEDYDVHVPRRQTDYYLMPAIIGLETVMNGHANFFIEAGAAYSFNGMEFADGSILYAHSWFPTARLGIALRTGKSTAIYYTRETMPLSRSKQAQ